MSYADAIYVCDTIGEEQWKEEAILLAVEKILSMETINAVRKDTLLKVIRWFWDNCVEET